MTLLACTAPAEPQLDVDALRAGQLPSVPGVQTPPRPAASPLPKCMQLVSGPLGEGGERPETFTASTGTGVPRHPVGATGSVFSVFDSSHGAMVGVLDLGSDK